MKIEESSAKTQARIDSLEQVVIGINKYPLDEKEDIPVLSVNNDEVRNAQIKRLRELKEERNESDVKASLEALTHCAESSEGNLLALAIEAARKGATVGEISYALEKVYGRHQAQIRAISGVYKKSFGDEKIMSDLQNKIEAFEKNAGRRPRILLAKMGQDGHDRGQKVIATAYADIGFDVDIGPLFQTPEESAKQAVENDVHVIGVSSLAAGHLTLVPKLKAALKEYGREDIMIVVGGVIPPDDYQKLLDMGVSQVFGPGTVIHIAADQMLDELNLSLGFK